MFNVQQSSNAELAGYYTKANNREKNTADLAGQKAGLQFLR